MNFSWEIRQATDPDGKVPHLLPGPNLEAPSCRTLTDQQVPVLESVVQTSEKDILVYLLLYTFGYPVKAVPRFVLLEGVVIADVFGVLSEEI